MSTQEKKSLNVNNWAKSLIYKTCEEKKKKNQRWRLNKKKEF